jgi:hypothetical protein
LTRLLSAQRAVAAAAVALTKGPLYMGKKPMNQATDARDRLPHDLAAEGSAPSSSLH